MALLKYNISFVYLWLSCNWQWKPLGIIKPRFLQLRCSLQHITMSKHCSYTLIEGFHARSRSVNISGFLLPLSFFNSTLADLLCKYQIHARNVIFLWAIFNNHVRIYWHVWLVLNVHLIYLVTVSTRNRNNMQRLFHQKPTFQVQ